MKKQFIAVAIAAAFAAPAMAQNVTISGNLDMGFKGQDNKTDTLARKTAGSGNGSSTSTFSLSAVEDLGGGLKAEMFLGNDLASGSSSASSSILAGQSYLGVSGGFGTIRAGNINAKALDASNAAQPFGTAIGGGYSGDFSRLSRGGVNGDFTSTATGTSGLGVAEGEVNNAGTSASGARVVRANRTLAYTSPSFGGFQLGYSNVAKNGNNGTSSAAVVGADEYSAMYSGNGLNVVAAQYTLSTGTQGFGLSANEKLRHNMAGANYAITNMLTIYAGMTTSKNTFATKTSDSSSRNVALKYNVDSKIALMANVLKVDDKLAGNKDRNLTGIGADYALSKRTTAYARWESGDNDKSAATGKFTNYALGLRHTF